MFDRAKQNELNIPNDIKNSYTKGERIFDGCLGEQVVCKFLNTTTNNTFDYDILYNDISIEVKTKTCKNPEYHMSYTVYESSTHQKNDIYAFVRLLEDFSKGYVCGFIPRDLFYKQAKFMDVGDIDPVKYKGQNFVIKKQRWQLADGMLHPLAKVRKMIGK